MGAILAIHGRYISDTYTTLRGRYVGAIGRYMSAIRALLGRYTGTILAIIYIGTIYIGTIHSAIRGRYIRFTVALHWCYTGVQRSQDGC